MYIHIICIHCMYVCMYIDICIYCICVHTHSHTHGKQSFCWGCSPPVEFGLGGVRDADGRIQVVKISNSNYALLGGSSHLVSGL